MKKGVIVDIVAKLTSTPNALMAKAPVPKAASAKPPLVMAAKMSHVRMGINEFGRIVRFAFRSTYMGNSRKCGPIIQLVF